jgi:hypothetical protein
MADRVLFIGWSGSVRGREERSLEVFDDAMGLLGHMQQDGRIERFDVVLLGPNPNLGGFVTIQGTAKQIDALVEDEAFQRNTADAVLAVEDIQHIRGYANEGVAQQMAIFRQAVSHVPQNA